MKKTAVLISVMAGLFIFVSGFFGLARDQYSHLANFSAALASEIQRLSAMSVWIYRN